MQTRLNPYLSFRDNARQAMEFYHSVFGGKLVLNTFKEFNLSADPSDDEKIMHGMLETENGLVLMGADTPSSMEYRAGLAMTISLSGDNEAELTAYYQKLLVGGTVVQPLDKSPWGDTFGMLTDPFGVDWMVNIAGTPG